MISVVERLNEGTQQKDFQSHLIAKAWKDESFREELLSDPKAVIEREFGTKTPENTEIRVLEETPDTIYLVLPWKGITTRDEHNLLDSDVDGVGGNLFLGQGNSKTCSQNTNQCN